MSIEVSLLYEEYLFTIYNKSFASSSVFKNDFSVMVEKFGECFYELAILEIFM